MRHYKRKRSKFGRFYYRFPEGESGADVGLERSESTNLLASQLETNVRTRPSLRSSPRAFDRSLIELALSVGALRGGR